VKEKHLVDSFGCIKKIFKKEVNIATRTISNTGGNYNAVGAWVEGIVPTSADDVVATATSGQLTVNVASSASTFSFTNYVNTLTMNAVWTVSGTGTQRFVSAMTISGSSNIALTGSGATIVTNGKTIPNLQLSGNKTISDTLNIVNLSTPLNPAGIFSGTQTINVSGNTTLSWLSNYSGAGITLNLTGTGTFTGTFGFLATNINTAGTITLTTTSSISSAIKIQPATTGVLVALNYIAGTIAGDKTLGIVGINAALSLFSLNTGGMTWKNISYQYTPNSVGLSTITLASNLNFTGDLSFAIGPSFPGITIPSYLPITINGTGRLNGGRLVLNTGILSAGSIQPTGSPFYILPHNIKFGSPSLHTLTELSSSSLFDNPNLISSQTASTTAYLSVSATQSVQNTNFTDIDATGGPIKTFRSTLTRTTEITNFTEYGGTVAFTFLN